MNNEMALWAEGFLKHYPNVKIEIEGKGSSTAPPALDRRHVAVRPDEPSMKDAEVADFEKKFGYKPTPLPTSIDMLAAQANVKDNPIIFESVQADAIFRRPGGFRRTSVLWPADWRMGQSADLVFMVAISIRNVSASSTGNVLFKETTRTRLKSSRVRRLSFRVLRATSTASATRASATRRPTFVRSHWLRKVMTTSKPFRKTLTPANTRWPASCICMSITSRARISIRYVASSSSTSSRRMARKT